MEAEERRRRKRENKVTPGPGRRKRSGLDGLGFWILSFVVRSFAFWKRHPLFCVFPNMPPSTSMARPPELATDAQWDRAIELTLRRLVYGAGAGLALGLIFTRSSAGRGRAMSFGLGMGVGSAYTDASREFGGVVPPLPSVLQPTPK